MSPEAQEAAAGKPHDFAAWRTASRSFSFVADLGAHYCHGGHEGDAHARASIALYFGAIWAPTGRSRADLFAVASALQRRFILPRRSLVSYAAPFILASILRHFRQYKASYAQCGSTAHCVVSRHSR